MTGRALSKQARALCAALILGCCAWPVASQTVAPEVEAYSHILSAFTSGADPRVLSDALALGPVLRREFGAETSSGKIYDALIDRAGSSRPSLRALPPGEAASFASVPGVNATQPLFTLQAGEVTLLLQYAIAQKRVSFVEQLHAPAPAEPPVVAVPLAAPPPAPAAAPVVAVPAVAPAAAARPTPAPPAKPLGPCVIKPVMSDDDLRNCAAASASRPTATAVERPTAAPVAAPASGAPTLQAPPPARPCVIKPVMSDEDLRACGVRR